MSIDPKFVEVTAGVVRIFLWQILITLTRTDVPMYVFGAAFF